MDSHDEATVAGNDVPASGRRPPAEVLLTHGDRLGRYTVLELLGRGGMGLVYGAYDPQLDRRVAVKVLLSRGSGRKQERARQRLVREAQAMAKISHPNVVVVHDAGTFAGEVFVAMEFVDGPTLRQWLDKKQRTVQEILDVFVQAGRGLAAAHAQGLVHRDFKPTNVLIDRQQHAKVTDFGLVWTATNPSEPPTSPQSGPAPSTPDVTQGGLLGTPAYMAPEQHARGPIDARADQFGFCVSLFDALYGMHPFTGESALEIAGAVSGGERRPLPTDPSVPAHIRRAVWRGLEHEGHARWPTMDALLEALLDDPARRRRRAWWIGGAVAASVASVVAITVAANNYSSAQPPPPCAGAGDEIDRVWSKERQQEIGEAFAGTQQPHAPGLWERSATLIGSYAARWRASARDACEATRVRGEQSDSLFDLRRACLDRRLHELDTRLGLLEQMDEELLDRSFAIATGAAAVEDCEDTERLRQTVPPPSDAEQAQRVQSLREQLGKVRVLYDAGRAAEIDTEVMEMVSEADATQYAPLRGEVHAFAAKIHTALGRWKEAEATWRDAARYAAEGHDDLIVAKAWSEMPYLVGYLQARVSDAELLAPVAEAALARVGRPASLMYAFEHGMGTMRFRQGDRAAARTHYLAALQLKGDGDAHAHDRAQLTNNLAVLRMTDGYYVEAGELFERSLGVQRDLLRPDHPDLADLEQNLGNVAVYLGHYEAALRRFDRALKIARAAEPEGGPRVIANLANRSLVLHQLGRDEQARADADEAIGIARRLFGENHPASMVTWVNLGRVERDAGNIEAARAAVATGAAIAESALGADHHDMGLFESERGAVEKRAGNLEAAAALLDSALEKLATAYGADHPMLGELWRERAEVDVARGDAAAAIVGFTRAISILEKRPGDPRELARSRFGLAEVLVQQDPTRAATLARQARELWVAHDGTKEIEEIDRWMQSVEG